MTDYEYDPELPYVVELTTSHIARARFKLRSEAEAFAEGKFVRIIDTTPKPRVPDDAKWITWIGDEYRHYAEASDLPGRWFDDEGNANFLLEDLPGVTPDTVFTVLDERKS